MPGGGPPPIQPPPKPPAVPSKPGKIGKPSSEDQASALENSPFAKMFEATGAMPTAKEIRAIINGILRQQVAVIKRDDEEWKKANRKLKEAIEGND